MAYYKKSEIYKQCIEVCRKGGCMTVEDVFYMVGVSRGTFYTYFPSGSKELENIKEELRKAKRKACVSIRGKLYKSKSPSALLALYRMLCDEDERMQITLTHTDITSKGNEIKNDPLIVEVIDKREQIEKAED